MSAAAKREWRRIVPLLLARRTLQRLDRTALALHCQAYGDYLELRDIVAAEGVTTTTDKGNVVQHPALGARNKAWAMVLKSLVEFGMTPASRASVPRASGGGTPRAGSVMARLRGGTA